MIVIRQHSFLNPFRIKILICSLVNFLFFNLIKYIAYFIDLVEIGFRLNYHT